MSKKCGGKTSSEGRAGRLHPENPLGVTSPTTMFKKCGGKTSSEGRAGTLHPENPLGVTSPTTMFKKSRKGGQGYILARQARK